MTMSAAAKPSEPGEPQAPDADEALARGLALAFAPLHKAALGVAFGAASALALFGVTAAQLVIGPGRGLDLSLLAQYFAGYEVSWRGAFIGAAWGFFVGFVGGWFTAFTRNLVVAIWLLIVRARADMEATRDFLDHI
jgi:hypothetical protein